MSLCTKKEALAGEEELPTLCSSCVFVLPFLSFGSLEKTACDSAGNGTLAGI